MVNKDKIKETVAKLRLAFKLTDGDIENYLVDHLGVSKKDVSKFLK
jgi:hypothetical protein